MNIGIYTRKSVYSDKSDSIDSQYNLCKDYVQNNYSVTSLTKYTDEGFTGANTHRPGFSQLMGDIKNKKIDVLICYKIDRLSRNVLDFSSTFNTLQEHDVQFVSVKEQIDTSTPLGRAMMYICSVFAQMERETIAERIKDNMIELAKSGKWAGGKSPIGYKREKTVINGKKHTILSKNETEIPFLNLIFDTFLEGFTLNGLETHFRKNGIKTLNNNYLSSSQIFNILKSPCCVENTKQVYDYFENLGCIMACDRNKFDGKNGIVVYGRTSGGKKKIHKNNSPDKWIVSIGLHEPLIPATKWLKVQQKFGKNIIDKTRKHEIGLLKGILRCTCGYTMRVQHKVDKTYNKIYDNYFCLNRNRRGIEYCTQKMVSVDILDKKIIDFLKQLSIDKKLLEKYIKQSRPSSPLRNEDVVRKELLSTTKKIENLTSTLHDNTNSSAAKYIIAEIEKIDKQIVNLNYELREIDIANQKISEHNNDIDKIYKDICTYINNIESLPYSEQVAWINRIIKECIWDGQNLTVTM